MKQLVHRSVAGRRDEDVPYWREKGREEIDLAFSLPRNTGLAKETCWYISSQAQASESAAYI